MLRLRPWCAYRTPLENEGVCELYSRGVLVASRRGGDKTTLRHTVGAAHSMAEG